MLLRYPDTNNYRISEELEVTKNDYRVAIKAYTSNIPIIVNGTDINKAPYLAINYQPNPSIPAYSYVPIAQFKLVGATVLWDEVKSTIIVQTDYYKNKDNLTIANLKITDLQNKYDVLQSKYNLISKEVITPEDIEYAKTHYKVYIDQEKQMQASLWPMEIKTIKEYKSNTLYFDDGTVFIHTDASDTHLDNPESTIGKKVKFFRYIVAGTPDCDWSIHCGRPEKNLLVFNIDDTGWQEFNIAI